MRPSQAFIASATREAAFLRKSPWDFALVTWIPLSLLAILAWLFSSGLPRELPIAVVDEDRSPTSRELVRMLDAAPAIKIVAQPASLPEAWVLARSLTTYATVYIPRDVTRELKRGGQGTVIGYYNASHQTAGQAAVRDIVSVVQAFGAQRPRLHPAPIAVRSSFLFNSARSTQFYLLALLFPAILHLGLCLAMAAAFGRELRDGTAGSWLGTTGNALLPAVAGKAAPYLLLFTLYGTAGLVWLTWVRSEPVRGSVPLLIAGQFLLYLAYAMIALLLVGATKNMGSTLSLVSLYAGTSLAFSGITFPLEGASRFTRAWNQMLPYTAYVHLQSQQLSSGSAWTVSLTPIAVLLLFIVVVGLLGLRAYGRAARDPGSWGER
jgi:ABC-2 type transport system permease protein